MRGRKPKAKAAEKAYTKPPEPPPWLTPEAADEWRRVTPDLVERRVLVDAVLGTLESYCTTMGIVRRAQAGITADGRDVVDGRRHPLFQNLLDALRQSRQFAAELGLTPASRGRTAGTSREDADGWTDLDL